ncbi:MAG: hypothetical protein ACYDGR_00640 [Candidatus Dormibacteria bacterium]
MSAESPHITFTVLLPGVDGERAGRVLADALRQPAAELAAVFLPGVRGKQFFDCPPEVSARLDAEWATRVGRDSTPVFVAFDEPGLEEWIPGLDGLAFVGVADLAAGRRYRPLGPQVHAVASLDPVVIAEYAIQSMLVQSGGSAPHFRDDLEFSDWWVDSVSRPEVAPLPSTSGDPAPAHLAVPDSGFAHLARAVMPPANPSETLAAPTVDSPGTAGGGFLKKLALRTSRRDPMPADLAPSLLACAPLVVVVASRKGGVGKTASSAGIAVVAGMAMDATGAKAALVDANVGNPAAWGDLNVPDQAATVRACVGRLNANLEPPLPAYANTPGLACYREDRHHSEGYAADEIARFCDYLCRRHSVVVVDMPNRLPGVQSAEAEVAMHWLALADVLVLPTDAGPEGVIGVGEYLDEVERLSDAPGLSRAIPTVVAFLAPQSRAVRNNPRLAEELSKLEDRAGSVVWVPRDEKAVLALWTERSITQVSPRLRDAYIRLTGAVVDAVRR